MNFRLSIKSFSGNLEHCNNYLIGSLVPREILSSYCIDEIADQIFFNEYWRLSNKIEDNQQ